MVHPLAVEYAAMVVGENSYFDNLMFNVTSLQIELAPYIM
jgi:hypothetical protein